MAGRCSGRAGSGRDAPLPGTPLWLSSGGAFSNLHTEPPSPAHTEDAAGKQFTVYEWVCTENKEIHRTQDEVFKNTSKISDKQSNN